MTEYLACPACGCTSFEQDRTVVYAETRTTWLSLKGEVEDERIDDQELTDVESSGPFRCEDCGWQVVNENGDPIDDPAEIVAKFEKASRSKHVGTHVREAFQEFIEGDADAVDVDGEQVGLGWFVERLTGCTDILPAGYCSDLDLPHGSTYGDAVAHLAKEGHQ